MIEFVGNSVRRVTELFKNCPGWEGCSGGYFCLADADTGLPLIVTLIGTVTVSVEEALKHLLLCVEQARRLADHPDYQTNFESQSPVARVPGQTEGQQWPGAVRDAMFIFSFYGLRPPGNELAMMDTVRFCRPGPHRDLDRIAESHGIMPYWEQLTQLLVS